MAVQNRPEYSAVQEDVNSDLSNQPQESIDPSKSEEEATANQRITVSEQHTPNNIAQHKCHIATGMWRMI